MDSAKRSRVVITGLGMSTSLGSDVASCWTALTSGRSGIGPISFWDPALYPVKLAAQVNHIPPDSGSGSIPRGWCRRSVRLFQGVANEAFRDAKLHRVGLPPEGIGLAVGASVNYVDMRLLRSYYRSRTPDGLTVDIDRVAGREHRDDGVYYRRLGEMMIAAPANTLSLRGPAFVVDTACAASAHAIGEAYRMVRRGQVKAMLAGGSAALVSPFSILAFSLLGALSYNSEADVASRPFDRKRDGFVMGEGAGAVVLESLESARARGANIYAELVGFGSTMNAHTLTDPSPNGFSEARAICLALREANMRPAEVDYIAAHGTSTPKNDATETRAIKRVFRSGAHRLLISSNKGQIGHTISAAGVLNLICAVRAVTDQVVPPTMNLHHPDPECDLDYVPNASRSAAVRAALAHAFAFGGQNAVLAVRRI